MSYFYNRTNRDARFMHGCDESSKSMEAHTVSTGTQDREQQVPLNVRIIQDRRIFFATSLQLLNGIFSSKCTTVPRCTSWRIKEERQVYFSESTTHVQGYFFSVTGAVVSSHTSAWARPLRKLPSTQQWRFWYQ